MWGPCSLRELTADEIRAALLGQGEMRKSAILNSAPGLAPKWKVVGIATTEHRDLQDDRIRQDGLDFSELIANGFINDDHLDRKEGPRAIIGYPTKVWPVKVKGKNGVVAPGTAIEGYFFDTPRANELAALAKAMEGTPRQFGFSVQGPTPTRDIADRREIVQAKVEHLAFTPWPVNPEAVAVVELVKSLSAEARELLKSDTTTLAPIMPESLGLPVVNVTIDPKALAKMMADWDPMASLGTVRKSRGVETIKRRLGVDSETAERVWRLAGREN